MKKPPWLAVLSLVLISCGCQLSPSPFPPLEPAVTPTPTALPRRLPPAPVPPRLPVPSPSPVPSPTPGPSPALDMEVLFHSDRDGESEIYTLDFSTGTLHQFTANQVFDGYASWSPDRSKILFVSERDGNREIYLMDSDGDNPTRLTENEEADGFPCWSPDGNKIAFFSGEEAADNIRVMDLASREVELITDFEEGCGGTMTFSPDGQKLVFGYERLGKYKIYLVDFTGNEPREIINHACEDSRICWSKDEQALIYVSGKGNQKDIWMLFVEDGRFKHITNNTASDLSPCISPEGNEVIFCSCRNGNAWQMYLVSLEGEPAKNPVRRLTHDSFNYHYPDWK